MPTSVRDFEPYASSINRPMLSSIISQVCAQSWVKKLTVKHTVSQELYHIFAFLHSGLPKNVGIF